MSYSGYRIKVNGNVLSDKWISKGTFNAVPQKRVCSTYTDANGVEHNTYYPTAKEKITFSIRERNESEQEEIKWLWASTDNLSVEYWDDASCSYKSGIFKMDRPTFNHYTINGVLGLMYSATAITMEEN